MTHDFLRMAGVTAEAARTREPGAKASPAGLRRAVRRRARRFLAQTTTPVTETAATTRPMIEIRMRPGRPRMRPEWSGNWAWTKMSAAVPFQGWRSPR